MSICTRVRILLGRQYTRYGRTGHRLTATKACRGRRSRRRAGRHSAPGGPRRVNHERCGVEPLGSGLCSRRRDQQVPIRSAADCGVPGLARRTARASSSATARSASHGRDPWGLGRQPQECSSAEIGSTPRRRQYAPGGGCTPECAMSAAGAFRGDAEGRLRSCTRNLIEEGSDPQEGRRRAWIAATWDPYRVICAHANKALGEYDASGAIIIARHGVRPECAGTRGAAFTA